MEEHEFQSMARSLQREFEEFCGGDAYGDFRRTLRYRKGDETELPLPQRRLWTSFLVSLFGPDRNDEALSFIVLSQRHDIYRYLFSRSDIIGEVPYEKILRLFRSCSVHGFFLAETAPEPPRARSHPREAEERYFPFAESLGSEFFGEPGGRFYHCPACAELRELWALWGCYERSEPAGLLRGDFTGKELLGSRYIACAVDPFRTGERAPVSPEELREHRSRGASGSLCGEDLRTLAPRGVNKRIRFLRRERRKGRYHKGELDWLLAFAAPAKKGPPRYADWVLEQFNTTVLGAPFRWTEPPDNLGCFDRSDFLIGRHWAGTTRPLSLLHKRAGLFFQDTNNSFTVTVCVDGTRRGPQPAALICAWETLANLHLFLDPWGFDDNWANLCLSFPCQKDEEVFDLRLIHGQEGTILGGGFGGMTEGGEGLYMWLDAVAAALRSMRKVEKISRSPEFRALEERIDDEEIRGYEIAGELWEIASRYAPEELSRNSYIQPLKNCRDEWAAAERNRGSG